MARTKQQGGIRNGEIIGFYELNSGCGYNLRY